MDWLVGMTGRVGCPHSMVPKVEFFACAHVMRLSWRVYKLRSSPFSWFLVHHTYILFFSKTQREITMASLPLSKNIHESYATWRYLRCANSKHRHAYLWTLLSGHQKYLTIHWMASAFRNFENTIQVTHGLSLYTPHHDIARCCRPTSTRVRGCLPSSSSSSSSTHTTMCLLDFKNKIC